VAAAASCCSMRKTRPTTSEPKGVSEKRAGKFPRPFCLVDYRSAVRRPSDRGSFPLRLSDQTPQRAVGDGGHCEVEVATLAQIAERRIGAGQRGAARAAPGGDGVASRLFAVRRQDRRRQISLVAIEVLDDGEDRQPVPMAVADEAARAGPQPVEMEGIA